MKEYCQKNNCDDPPITTYNKIYGNGEKNLIHDPLEGGKRNKIGGHEFQWKNKQNLFNNLAGMRDFETSAITTLEN